MLRLFIVLLIFIVECAKYISAYFVVYSDRNMKKWPLLLGGMGITVLLIWMKNTNPIVSLPHILLYGLVLIVVYLMIRESLSRRILRILFLSVILVCIDEIFTMILDLVSFCGVHISEDGDLRYLYQSVLTLMIIFLILSLQKKYRDRRKKAIFIFTRRWMLYIVTILCINITGTIALLNHLRNQIFNVHLNFLILFLCLIAYLGLLLLILFSFYLKYINAEIEQKLEMEREYKQMQSDYYHELLEKERDTKKYRHDMGNHLVCLEAFANDNDMESLRQYLSKIHGEVLNIQNKGHLTGNKVLDILTNHYLSLIPKEISISVNGKIFTEIRDDKLCIIYGNLLQNAVEALQRYPGDSDRFLRIELQQGKVFCQIKIENGFELKANLMEKQHKIGRKFTTKKNDNGNHGLGLQNVDKVVSELQGKMEIKRQANLFRVVVQIPHKNTV